MTSTAPPRPAEPAFPGLRVTDDRPVAGPPRWSRDVALVAVVAGIAAQGWRWAANWPLWLDEQLIAMNLRDRGFADLAGPLDNNQGAPLGWLWVERAVVELFGTGERSLRAVPLLSGVGALLVAWAIGRRWLGPVGRFALVGFCAVSPALVRYAAEVKPYAGDVFWVFVVLGLAGWVVEEPRSTRRLAIWWGTAVIASWLSIGAFLVMPGLAAVVILTVAWRAGWPGALRACLLGVAWLASFGLHYLLAIRFTTGNSYLTTYWQDLGYPQDGIGPLGLVSWAVARVRSLSSDPLHLDAGIGDAAGAFVATLFWVMVVVGIGVALRRYRPFGLLLAMPLVSALVFGAVRVVPLAGRLAMWILPAVLLAAAVAVDAAARRLRRGPGRPLAGVGLALLLALVPTGAAVVAETAAPPAVDDRAAIRWLKEEHRPGDITIVVGFASRALAWYDHQRVLRPYRTVVEVPPGEQCDPGTFRRITSGHDRVLGYVGQRRAGFEDADQVLAARPREVGRIVETRSFGGGAGVGYVVDLRATPEAVGRTGWCLAPR